jgi:hypothetical protein
MADDKLVCWKCGAELRGVPLPLSRLAECASCKAELHVCRLCQNYEANTVRKCREIRAEDIINKERANYCDWFKPRPGAFDSRRRAKTESAKARLDGLFGGSRPTKEGEDAARAAAERLFSDKPRKE